MEKYDIFIQAGQSNAEGNGFGEIDIPYEKDERVLHLTFARKLRMTETELFIDYIDEPFTIKVADERTDSKGNKVSDFSLSFAKKYINAGLLKQDRKILVIRAAIGGTGFARGHWKIGDSLYEKMISMIDYALSLNPENQLKGFLWHQGEMDVMMNTPAKEYYDNFKAMFQSVKQRYNIYNLPIVSAGFSPVWFANNKDNCLPIFNEIKRVIQEENGAFVDTTGLETNSQALNNDDILHFSRRALYDLGDRYFEAYKSIVTNETYCNDIKRN